MKEIPLEDRLPLQVGDTNVIRDFWNACLKMRTIHLILTIPHVPFRGTGLFQVKCWIGGYGEPEEPGNVVYDPYSGQGAIEVFETAIHELPANDEWEAALQEVGIDVHAFEVDGRHYDWCMESKHFYDRGYYVIRCEEIEHDTTY